MGSLCVEIGPEAAVIKAVMERGRSAAPQYKGAAFNKMINHGAKGRFAHAAFTIAAWPFLVPKTEDSVRKALDSRLDALAA